MSRSASRDFWSPPHQRTAIYPVVGLWLADHRPPIIHRGCFSIRARIPSVLRKRSVTTSFAEELTMPARMVGDRAVLQADTPTTTARMSPRRIGPDFGRDRARLRRPRASGRSLRRLWGYPCLMSLWFQGSGETRLTTFGENSRPLPKNMPRIWRLNRTAS